MNKNPRLIITLPKRLKEIVRKVSEYRSCSQAEIIKTALYLHLKDFIDKDNKEAMK